MDERQVQPAAAVAERRANFQRATKSYANYYCANVMQWPRLAGCVAFKFRALSLCSERPLARSQRRSLGQSMQSSGAGRGDKWTTSRAAPSWAAERLAGWPNALIDGKGATISRAVRLAG